MSVQTPSKKRILEFSSCAEIGGTQKEILKLLRHFSREKYEFSLCVLLEHGILNEEADKLDLDHTSLNMRGYWDLSAWWKLYRFARDRHFDLMRTYGLKADIIGRIVGKMLRIPVNITSVHSTDPWRRWYHVLLDRQTAGLTDLYLSNSEAGRLAIHQREGIPLEKIFTIPNGIDWQSYEETNSQASETNVRLRKELNIPSGAPVIGSIANLCKMKGHTIIVDALPLIQQAVPEVKCLFAGTDYLHGRIQAYVREKKAENAVIFTGFRQDVPEMCTLLDIYLLPSEWEGLPTAILEAMAMKKPVVASHVGGIPELVVPGETGILIPPHDPQALADAVIHLLKNPGIARKMGQAGYERARRHFSLDDIVARTEAVYDHLIEEKRSDSP